MPRYYTHIINWIASGFSLFLFSIEAFSFPLPPKSHTEKDSMQYNISAVKVSRAPIIDGILNDEIWKKAQPATNFIQTEPKEGEPATEKTEVYVLYDDQNLYVGFRCYDSEPQKIIARLGRREHVYSTDYAAFAIDTYHDHQTGYQFWANAAGVEKDSYMFNDSWRDDSWDAVWDVRTHIDSQGWSAEFIIPLKTIRFPRIENQTWGINFHRRIERKREDVYWNPVSRDDWSFRMSKLGHLAGLEDLAPGRYLEILPYSFAGMDQEGGKKSKGRPKTGIDLKYGLTSNLTLDFTVNPDFAQIEADAFFVNLSRYEYYLREKRPFFLEGRKMFSSPIDLFYSRRIGSKGDILWGAKLTGKLGPYSLGVLQAQTGDWNYFGLEKSNPDLERAYFTVLGLKRDIWGSSKIGLLFTNKNWPGGYSRAGGFDANFVKGYNEVRLGVASSWNPGIKNRNYAYQARFNRYTDFFSLGISARRTDPEFKISETGFLRKEDHRGSQSLYGWVYFSPRPKFWGIRWISFGLNGGVDRTLYTDEYFIEWQQNNPDLQIAPNFNRNELQWDLWGRFGINWYSRDGFNINGGYSHVNELTGSYDYKSVNFNLWTNSSRPISGYLWLNRGTTYNWDKKYVGTSRSGEAELNFKPLSNLSFSIEAEHTRTYDPDKTLDRLFWVTSFYVTYLFTKDLFIRTWVQSRYSEYRYEEISKSQNAYFSFLLGYEFLPGSFFYLVYNDTRNGEPSPLNLQNRLLAAKLTYFWRI